MGADCQLCHTVCVADTGAGLRCAFCRPDPSSIGRPGQADPAQFAGSWSQVTGHQANLFADNTTDPSMDNAVKFYMHAGVASHKLVIGRPRSSVLCGHRCISC